MSNQREGKDYEYCEKLKQYVDYPYFTNKYGKQAAFAHMETVMSESTLKSESEPSPSQLKKQDDSTKKQID